MGIGKIEFLFYERAIEMSEIDVRKIKEVNNQCNAYKKKASELLAEKEYKTKALNDMCIRLSEILGIEVTTANLKDIYNQRVEKVNQTLQICNDMIERIKRQEAGEEEAEGNNTGSLLGEFRQQEQPQVAVNTEANYFGSTQSLGSMPESDYKMPSGMVNMLPPEMREKAAQMGQQGSSGGQRETGFGGIGVPNVGTGVNLKSFLSSVPKENVVDEL